MRRRCRHYPARHFNPRTHEGCDFIRDGTRSSREISIHAPTRGATLQLLRDLPQRQISIHAPTRGATRSRTRCCTSCGFQSTHPRGVRLCVTAQRTGRLVFQSTHPRGCDPDIRSDTCNWKVISIHAPTRGATLFILPSWSFWIISIHAPTRGATLYTAPFGTHLQNFNPRTHEGCDSTIRQVAG